VTKKIGSIRISQRFWHRIGAELRGHAHLSTTEIYTHVAIHKLKSIHAATHPARLADGVAGRVQGSDDPNDPKPTADGASPLALSSRADVLDAPEREDEDDDEAE